MESYIFLNPFSPNYPSAHRATLNWILIFTSTAWRRSKENFSSHLSVRGSTFLCETKPASVFVMCLKSSQKGIPEKLGRKTSFTDMHFEATTSHRLLSRFLSSWTIRLCWISLFSFFGTYAWCFISSLLLLFARVAS